jgi:hypothetical protein
MDVEPQIAQNAITLAADLAKQILTLATGILALTITFYKDLDSSSRPKKYRRFLYWGWLAFLASVLLGLLTMGKLVSLSLNPIDPSIKNNLDGASLWAFLQWLSFFIGVCLIVTYGFFVVRNASTGQITKPARPPSASD